MKTYHIPDVYVREYLLPNDGFKNILNDLALSVNQDKLVIIFKDTGEELQEPTLKKIYLVMQNIIKDSSPDAVFYEVLKNILLNNLSFGEIREFDKQILEYKELNLIVRGNSFLDGNEDNLAEILANLNEDYLRYETICEILKENFGIDISKSDHRLAKFLTDLGYKKIRKRIEGKQQNVWVK